MRRISMRSDTDTVGRGTICRIITRPRSPRSNSKTALRTLRVARRKPGSPATVREDPQSAAFTIVDRLTTGARGSKDTSEIDRPWNEPLTIEMTGSYPLGAQESGDIAPSVPDPESYAGDVFVRALAAEGITVGHGLRDGKTPSSAAVLWSHDSEPLPQLLADFWYPSDNLMGELFLKELGVAQAGAPGSDDNGEIAETAFLRSIGVDPQTVSIDDGSGLSSYDRITPRDLLTILQADWNSEYRDTVLNALPWRAFAAR